MAVAVFVGFCLLQAAAPITTSVAASSQTRSAVQRHKHHTSWGSHDRAVYVVTTLNAPLCSNGQQLSTVLWNSYNARLFDVLASTTNKGLYFIQVRNASAGLLGVYSYQMGNKQPAGVQSYHCVNAAVSQTTQSYHAKGWKFMARFSSTYPKS